jgi:hypothetical protein
MTEILIRTIANGLRFEQAWRLGNSFERLGQS